VDRAAVPRWLAAMLVDHRVALNRHHAAATRDLYSVC
jgi:hypothetical protein